MMFLHLPSSSSQACPSLLHEHVITSFSFICLVRVSESVGFTPWSRLDFAILDTIRDSMWSPTPSKCASCIFQKVWCFFHLFPSTRNYNNVLKPKHGVTQTIFLRPSRCSPKSHGQLLAASAAQIFDEMYSSVLFSLSIWESITPGGLLPHVYQSYVSQSAMLHRKQ